MNEVSIELTQEEVTCLIAALGMTMDISDTYRNTAKKIINKVAKEQFTDDSQPIISKLASGSFETKGKYA